MIAASRATAEFVQFCRTNYNGNRYFLRLIGAELMYVFGLFLDVNAVMLRRISLSSR
jgi:hypothetical protein